MDQNELGLTLADHQKAFTEISFLLNIFALTIEDLMGDGSPTIGRLAGQHMARRLPIYLPKPTVENVVDALAKQMANGFTMTSRVDDAGVDIDFTKCAVRAVCQERQQVLGEGLCRLFHFAVGGMVNELMGKPARARILETGPEICKTRLDLGAR